MKKKEGVLHTPAPSNTPPITPNESDLITSLDGTSVTFTPNNDGIKREGNTVINTSNSNRNCFTGGVMRTIYDESISFERIDRMYAVLLRQSILSVSSFAQQIHRQKFSAKDSFASLSLYLSILSFYFIYIYIHHNLSNIARSC